VAVEKADHITVADKVDLLLKAEDKCLLKWDLSKVLTKNSF
jgi:hypothetical protein